MDKTSDKIIEYIKKNSTASGKELADYLGNITIRAVRKQLKSLTEKGIVQKIGKPPNVYYVLSSREIIEPIGLDKKVEKVINSRYIFISPFGEIKEGWEGFYAWCIKTKQNPIKTASEYIKTLKKYDEFRKAGLINGMPKMRATFSKVYLDKLFYLDFYSIERFGKTKLGQMLLYAKQSQNMLLITKLVDETRDSVIKIVNKYNIDGVIFIPPTVKREIQFMKILENRLHLPVSNMSVVKIKTEIIIPQKTLSNLEDRVENAKRTIIVDERRMYNNILMIDDAVGSGATLNESAKQIKNRNLVKGKIIGLAITGSFKGFDVISEV